MTGPEHYMETERLLAEATEATPGGVAEYHFLAAANVHALLALTAATYEASPGPYIAAWEGVTRGAAR